MNFTHKAGTMRNKTDPLTTVREQAVEIVELVEKGELTKAEKLYKQVRETYHVLSEQEKGQVFHECMRLHEVILQKKMDELQALLDLLDSEFSNELFKRFETIYWDLGVDELKSPRFSHITDRYADILKKHLEG